MKNKFLETGEPGYHPVRKLGVIFSGLRYAVFYDFSVLYKLILSVLVLLCSLWLHKWVDSAVILLATGVVLVAELFNTTLEALCDFVGSIYDEKIRIIKNIAAAAVGIAILAWLIVMGAEIVELWPKLTEKLL